jgi:hypothetical protein
MDEWQNNLVDEHHGMIMKPKPLERGRELL